MKIKFVQHRDPQKALELFSAIDAIVEKQEIVKRGFFARLFYWLKSFPRRFK